MTATAEPPSRPVEQVSLWALAAVMCAACPFMSLIGVGLSIIALLDIRRRPNRKGRGFAIGALSVSSVITAGWVVMAVWWYQNARRPMMYGPIEAMQAGLDGDVGGFRSWFVDDVGGDGTEAAAFLSAVNQRYGRLVASSQRRDDGSAAARNADLSQVWIPLSFQFERATREADASFVNTRPGAGLVLKFAWVAIRDADLGDLVYPPDAVDAANEPAPLPSQTGPVPKPREQQPGGGQGG